MNAEVIVNKSVIGQIEETSEMLAGGTFEEYKNAVVGVTQKIIDILPQAVAQGKAQGMTKISFDVELDTIFRSMLRKAWNKSTDVYVLQNGTKSITGINARNLDIIVSTLQVLANY